MNKLTMAVIGVGSMGRHHARVISEIENIELTAVVDNDINVANEIASKYNCKSFTTLEELITTNKPQALCVCVPTSLHLAIGKKCLENGIDVLIEKPIATTVEEAEELINLAKKHSRKLMVGHIERFNPAFKKVKEIIDDGDIGKIVAIHARRVGAYPPRIRDVNIAVDLAIHDIDLVNLLIDELPIKVTAQKNRNHLKYREDSVEIFMQYKNSSAIIQSNWITPVRRRSLLITGTDGYLEMDFLSQQISLFKSKYQKHLEDKNNPDSEMTVKYEDAQAVEVDAEKYESLSAQIKYFINAIVENKNIDAKHALQALEIAINI